jgi:ribosomal protein S18 acetylase RimI-like enzyme
MGPGDVSGVAGAMARAFFDDPVMGGWCLADQPRRMRRLERGFTLVLERGCRGHSEVYAVEGLTGGAVWLPPRARGPSGLERVWLLARMAGIYGRALPRVFEVLGFLEARHPREPHWYLLFVGVKPAFQGRGLGSALLAPVLGRCDRERVPAYLEASSERNRALYERLGFEVIDEVQLPAGGPPMWLMWRS